MATAMGRPPTPPRAAVVRVSEDEREHVVERLKAAFVEGRLDRQDFGLRIQNALVARTRSELTPLLADLEAPPVAPVNRQTTRGRGVYRPTAGERGWGMLSHLLGFTSFAGPLVVLLTKGAQSAFVRRQAAESVNFQLTFLLIHFLMIVASAATLGLGAILYALAIVPLMLGWLIFMLVGGVASLGGGEFRYPLTIRLVR